MHETFSKEDETEILSQFLFRKKKMEIRLNASFYNDNSPLTKNVTCIIILAILYDKIAGLLFKKNQFQIKWKM